MPSVCIERMTQRSSTCFAISGKSSDAHSPLWPCCAKSQSGFITRFCGLLPVFASAAQIGEIHHLPVVLGEPRLVVEGVDVAHAALHEEEDDALRPRREMRRLRRERIDRRGARLLLRREAGERERAKAAGELLQGGAAGEE